MSFIFRLHLPELEVFVDKIRDLTKILKSLIELINGPE